MDEAEKTGVDRISHLSEHLLHHILYKLDLDESARTSVLSKQWCNAWNSLLIIDFDDKPFVDIRTGADDFFPFVHRHLQTLCAEQRRSLERFRLSVENPRKDPNALVDDCINLAAAHRVKHLHLNLPIYGFQSVFPPSIYARSLQVLKLHGGRLTEPNHSSVDSMNFPSLKQLYLRRIDSTENLLQSLINACPLLEQLSIVYCPAFSNIRLCGLTKLKFLEILQDYYQSLHIDQLESLETFKHTGHFDCCATPHMLNIKGCRKLKVLKLENMRVTKQWLTLLSNFSALESLKIRNCCIDDRLNISNHHLQHLELSTSSPGICHPLLNDSINLRSFTFKGVGKPHWLRFLNRPTLHTAKIVLMYLCLESRQFFQLREILSKFNRSKILELHMDSHSYQVNFNLKDMRRKRHYPRRISKHVILNLIDFTQSVDYDDFGDGLIWAIRTRTLSIKVRPRIISHDEPDWTRRIELIEVLCRKLIRITKGLCCSSSPSKCWRHFIKSVKVVWGGGKNCDCERLLELLPTFPLYDHQFIRFRFKYN